MPSSTERNRQAIRRVLEQVWDPIGVNDMPGGPEDEYDAYILPILAMLKNGASNEALAAHLTEIETRRMGLTGNAARAGVVATALRALPLD